MYKKMSACMYNIQVRSACVFTLLIQLIPLARISKINKSALFDFINKLLWCVPCVSRNYSICSTYFQKYFSSHQLIVIVLVYSFFFWFEISSARFVQANEFQCVAISNDVRKCTPTMQKQQTNKQNWQQKHKRDSI